MTYDVSFGEWLRERREASDLTREELASRVGCSLETIRKIERGARRPSKQIAMRLADQLELPGSQRSAFIRHARSMPRVGAETSAPAAPARVPERTAAAARASLPALPAPLIGREIELAELGAMLADPACRLITIVGPGGIGKTQLALAAIAELPAVFGDGAVFVPLAGLSAARDIAPAIMAALGVALHSQRDVDEQLREHLQPKQLLLALDNFELLIDGADLLAALLQSAPKLKLLVTSRERLALQAEWLFDLHGLRYPHDEAIDDLELYSAVELFLRRARQVQHRFTLTAEDARAVMRICRLTEGMPLAIELAAASVRSYSCTAIANELAASARTLTGSLRDLPDRHRSMWAAFGHSWQLIAGQERQVLRRLAVFRGGFSRAAAAAVTGDQIRAVGSAEASGALINHARERSEDAHSLTILAQLIDKSLLRRSEAERYEMHELVRQYALEQLEAAGEAEATRTRHLHFFLMLAEAAAPHLDTRDRLLWIDRLQEEIDNLRAALAWSLEEAQIESEHTRGIQAGRQRSARQELGTRLAAALWRFWYLRRYRAEGRGWLQAATRACRARSSLAVMRGDRAALRDTQATLAQLLLGAGSLESIQGEYRLAAPPLEECLALFRALDDRRGIAQALREYGAVMAEHERFAEATALMEESVALFRALGDYRSMAAVLYHLAMNMTDRGDGERGVALASESLALLREFGDTGEVVSALNALAQAVMFQGDHARAQALLEEGLVLDHARDPQRNGSAWTFANLGLAVLAQGEYAYAASCYRESLLIRYAYHNRTAVAWCLEGLAEIAAACGEPLQAARLWGVAAALRAAAGAGMAPDDRARHERAVSAARELAGPRAFAAAWAAGQALTLDQAVAEALAENWQAISSQSAPPRFALA